MTFDEWLFQVCELISKKTHKEITDIFSSVDLSDAKLTYLDGIPPESYNPYW